MMQNYVDGRREEMIYVLVYIYIICAKHLWKGTKETYIIGYF